MIAIQSTGDRDTSKGPLATIMERHRSQCLKKKNRVRDNNMHMQQDRETAGKDTSSALCAEDKKPIKNTSLEQKRNRLVCDVLHTQAG